MWSKAILKLELDFGVKYKKKKKKNKVPETCLGLNMSSSTVTFVSKAGKSQILYFHRLKMESFQGTKRLFEILIYL